MFCYQRNFHCQCETVTPQLFAQLIVSDETVTRIKGYRNRLPQLQQTKAELERLRAELEALKSAKADNTKAHADELKEQIKLLTARQRDINSLKTSLPTLMYQVSQFETTASKKGYQGRWRKQEAARLNGLFMLDVDHVDEPEALFASWWKPTMEALLQDGNSHANGEAIARWADQLGIVLAHVTPSGRGLRLVATADPAVGNIADNQRALATRLAVEPDQACKDASRCSFCPMFDDILFINNEKLFSYDNKEYDEKYGPQYRKGNSQPTVPPAPHAAHGGSMADGDAHAGADGAVRKAAADAAMVGSGQQQADQLDERLTKGYRNVRYEKIIEQWYALVSKGMPDAGERHLTLLKMAGDLRYICDNYAPLLERVLKLSDTGKQLVDEGREQEIAALAADTCKRQLWRSIPKRMLAVLEAAGVQLAGAGADTDARQGAEVDYGWWWSRLQPLLSRCQPMEAAVKPLPDTHKLAGVLAAGAMLGTYLTRTWWTHFDGKDYRLSFLVYIIGDAASGKSFVIDLDRLIMAPMLAADRVGREWERQYKEEMKKRAASSKNAKAEAPEQQHPVIRYVPSTVSNAMLYRRLTDAIDSHAIGPDEQPMHLHCYTMEPELATALRAQQGSWAGKNDLELKSFQNEYAGVDYANDQSVNGIIQVNWNQVVTGTWESLARKIRPSMVLDGLVTRLVLFPMPSNQYAMIDRRNAFRDNERECLLRSLGLKLEDVRGELKAERLVQFCYDYETKLTDEARIEQDECLDYFRKRIPLIMMRYGLTWLVLRHPDKALNGEELPVDDDDLEFARLIGDWALMAQMHLFGQMVMEARQREQEQFTPRKRSTKVRALYESLPETFTSEDVKQRAPNASINYASTTVHRWLHDGLLERVDNRTYKKKYKEIPI